MTLEGTLFLVVAIIVGLLLIVWCLANDQVGGALFVFSVVAGLCLVGLDESKRRTS